MVPRPPRYEPLPSNKKLFEELKNELGRLKDGRHHNIQTEQADTLMSAFAIFSLKSPSLLMFEQESRQGRRNLQRIYGIEKVPSDQGMRDIIDLIDSEELRKIYHCFIKKLRKYGLFSDWEYIEGHKLISIDGVHHFSSKKINCSCCLVKKHKNGEKSYSHKVLSAALVNPDRKEVFVLDNEPIVNGDGNKKNDCEQNAGKRLLKTLRQQHKEEKIVLLLDALYSTGPFVEAMKAEDFSWIISAKEGSCGYVFVQHEAIQRSDNKGGRISKIEIRDERHIHRFEYVNDLHLNGAHQHLLVNFLRYEEENIKTGKIQKFDWITDIELKAENIYKMMRAGRARWKIENETFNTLKNLGYHFEHNYGHGKKNLATNFMLLMMLAFVIDQAQQYAGEFFKKAWKSCGTKKMLWQRIRAIFHEIECDSMETIYRIITGEYRIVSTIIKNDTS